MLKMDATGKIYRVKSGKSDFAFIYEVKPREMNAITLLGFELLRRGYSVTYVNTWRMIHSNDKKVDTDIAIISAGYNTEVISFMLSNVLSYKAVVNMQWEQVVALGDYQKEGNIYNFSGEAKNIYHFSWGEKNRNHLVEDCGIPDEKVKVVGHIGLDFLNLEFRNFFLSKNYLRRKYGILENQTIMLFVSSFATLSPNIDDLAYDYSFANIAHESKIGILKWVGDLLEENTKLFFIYRPHPAEYDDPLILNFERKHSNFHVIKDYNLQQWLIVADDILTWYSTSIIDIRMLGKPCGILRPIKIPNEWELQSYDGAELIENYEDLQQYLKQPKFPIKDEIIKSLYCIDSGMVYLKEADFLEELFRKKKDKGTTVSGKQHDKKSFLALRELYGEWKLRIKKIWNYSEAEKFLSIISYHKQMTKQNYMSEHKIKERMQLYQKKFFV